MQGIKFENAYFQVGLLWNQKYVCITYTMFFYCLFSSGEL